MKYLNYYITGCTIMIFLHMLVNNFSTDKVKHFSFLKHVILWPIYLPMLVFAFVYGFIIGLFEGGSNSK
jgi:hypothetical protein